MILWVGLCERPVRELVWLVGRLDDVWVPRACVRVVEESVARLQATTFGAQNETTT